MSLTKTITLIFGAALLSVACDDVTRSVRPEPAFAAGGDPKTSVAPNGQKLGTFVDSSGPRTRHRIENHGGPIMAGTSAVYMIRYGDWASDSATANLMADFASNIGASAYMRAVTRYADATGARPNSAIIYAGSVSDDYSQGASLTRAQVSTIVQSAIVSGGALLDPNGIYVVMATPDIEVTDLEQRTCAFHQHHVVNGTTVKIVYVGSPMRMPSLCVPQPGGPNGITNGDAMASLLAAELANAITNPTLISYYDRLGYEMADKCAWKYGTTYTAPNGARANVQLGQRHYLLQQLWVPTKNGGQCTLATPYP